MKQGKLFVFFLIFFLGACSYPELDEFDVIGWNKGKLIDIFGEPQRKSYFSFESFDRSMGPKPQFWKELVDGEKVEAWQYQIKEGHVQLYFYKSEKVTDVIHFRNDVMY